MFNQFRSFMQPNPAPQPRPMMPTMGTAIRGMMGGGGRPTHISNTGQISYGNGTMGQAGQVGLSNGGRLGLPNGGRLPGAAMPVLRGWGR